MKTIDLNDWVVNGAGGFGTSYFHKTNPALMLKIMAENVDYSAIEKELANAMRAYDLGLPTPKPGELVTDGKKVGIMFERIQGKVSFARAVGDTPEKIPELADEYSRMVDLLHSTKRCEGMVSVKEIYGKDIIANPMRSEAFKKRAMDLLYSLPDADTCLHGDMHFGNMITAGGKSYFIDMVDFCYGNPLFDFTMMGILLDFSKVSREIYEREYHCTPEQGGEFWHLVLKNCFGQNLDIDAKMAEIRPFAAVRAVVIETQFGQPSPEPIAANLFDYFE